MELFMKLEIGTKIPNNFKECWEGEYDIFSHLEFAWEYLRSLLPSLP
jgi:hypothetical protein